MENAVALGTFDGLHAGHRAVLALPEGCHKIAVTFSEPPKAVITGVSESITTAARREGQLRAIGMDEVVMLDFKQVRGLSPEDFLELIYKKYRPSVISCGFNYRFGRDGAGDTGFLLRFCRDNGIVFRCHEPVKAGGRTVSSTLIRELLKDGKTEKANELLFEPFSFTAQVSEGDRRGRTIGFPTINQRYPGELVQLRLGVYASEVVTGGGVFRGMTDIGIRPTFRTDYVISETHILGFSGNLYGEDVTIIPKKFLRPEIKFTSAEELKKQLEKDIGRVDS